jgi:hypothetical protein
MQTRLVWALLLATVACKNQPSEPPEQQPRSSPRSGYGELAWTEPTSIQPIEVCEHLTRMVAAEAGVSDPPIDPKLMADCESELAVEAGIRGTDSWNAIASCVLQARTKADIDYCDRTYPMPSQGRSQPGSQPGYEVHAVSERELVVCEHMIEVLMLESAAELGAVPTLTVEERQALVDECAQTLAFEQKPALSPAEYEQMLGCIADAESSDQMRACE